MQIMKKVDLDPPININMWKYDSTYYTDILIEMSYAIINKQDIENWSMKQISRYTGENPDTIDKSPGKAWTNIWTNLRDLIKLPYLHDIRFKLIYDIFQTNQIMRQRYSNIPVCA